MDIYSCLEALAEHGYNTVLQGSTNKGAAIRSSAPNKN